MPTHERNQKMRDKILNTARKLFYEVGYNNTRFIHIADQIGITKGLITYYFGTKANLANEVYTQYETEITNKINFMIYEKYKDQFQYQPKLVTVVIQLTTLNMLNQDEKARRFFVEHMYQNLQFSIEDTFLPFYMAQRRKGRHDEMQYYDSMKIMAFSQRAARAAVALAYFRGKLNLTFEEFVDYSLSVYWKIEQMSEAKIEELITEAKEIQRTLEIQIKPMFEI